MGIRPASGRRGDVAALGTAELEAIDIDDGVMDRRPNDQSVRGDATWRTAYGTPPAGEGDTVRLLRVLVARAAAAASSVSPVAAAGPCKGGGNGDSGASRSRNNKPKDDRARGDAARLDVTELVAVDPNPNDHAERRGDNGTLTAVEALKAATAGNLVVADTVDEGLVLCVPVALADDGKRTRSVPDDGPAVATTVGWDVATDGATPCFLRERGVIRGFALPCVAMATGAGGSGTGMGTGNGMGMGPRTMGEAEREAWTAVTARFCGACSPSAGGAGNTGVRLGEVCRLMTACE